jgi:hypothetical protein
MDRKFQRKRHAQFAPPAAYGFDTNSFTATMDFLWCERRAPSEEPANSSSILKEKDFSLTTVETPGTHDWTAWHYNLIHLCRSSSRRIDTHICRRFP